MKATLPLTFAALIAAGPVAADEFAAAMESFYQTQISGLASNPMLIEAINAQNAQTSGFSAAQIDELDKAWRAEVGMANTPTISPVLESAAADFLREQVANSGGQITEIILMDAQGLNVAASSTTSDYWQGDEEKHSETYGAGAGSLHISDVELDESTQTYQGQISFPVVDPATGAPIGAITVGVDAQSLM